MPNPNGLPNFARDHARRRFECVLIDPSVPAVADFIRQEVMRGTIRTVPVGVGLLMLVPTGVWPRGYGAQPD